MLLAVRCPCCGAPGAAPCRGCAARLRPPPSLPAPTGLDACGSLVAYEDEGRSLVTGLKYGRNRAAVAALARALAALALVLGIGPDTVVTWAPTTGERRRARGYDQAELLARRVAAELGRPSRRLLARPPGPAQTGRSRAERRAGPAFTSRGRSPPTVLLVDDVVTTGATLAAAAATLRRAGARHVVAVTVARTPAVRRSRLAPRVGPA